MSDIDTAINSLSSDELDLLNNDPKMLSDFKSKYSASPTVVNTVSKGVTETLKSSLLPNPDTFHKPLSGDPVEQLKQSLSGPLEGPSRMYASYKQGVNNVTSDLKDKGDIGATGKFVLDTASDPLTWAMSGMKLLPEEVESQIPKILEKTTNIPARATELEGWKQPIPTEEEIQKAMDNVSSTVKNVWQEHGDLLNKARAEAGLPQSKAEIADSVRKFGNPSNLNISKPLELSPNLKLDAPQMEESVPGATTKDWTGTNEVQAYIKGVQKGGISPNTGQPIPDAPIYGVRGDPERIKTLFGSSDVASVPKEMLNSKGIPTPDIPAKPMPFKIGDHDTPEQLMTEIERFKANLPYISKTDQAKVADYFQDQIQQQGVFNQDSAKGRVMGTLKGQYGDLADVIQNSSQSLQAAKSKMGDLYDTMDNLSKKLTGEPGEREAYLRKLFTSKSPEVKDDLNALAKIEHLSGKPVLQELFKKFAGESYGNMLGESVHSIWQAPYAALTSPRMAITPMAKYGPAVIRAAKFAGAGAIEKGFTPGQVNPDNGRELQSLKDRLNNARK